MGALSLIARDCFSLILEIENGLEMQRQELAQRTDFSLSGAFFFFANSTQHKLNLDELKFGLERLEIRQDPTLLMVRYDADEDGKLGLWEFGNIVLPLQQRMRAEIEGRQACYEMSFETKSILINVLRRSIDAEVEIEALRQRVCRDLTQPLKQVFESLDWLNRGFLSKGEFKRIIDQHCDGMEDLSNLHSVEMEALVRRFNKDRANGKVSLIEFVAELTPKI